MTPRSLSISASCRKAPSRKVAHDVKAELERVGFVVGQVEHVDGFVKGGVGVGVGTEGDAEALHLGDELAGIGEVACEPFEHHVLQEVGDSSLVIALHQGTGGDV